MRNHSLLTMVTLAALAVTPSLAIPGGEISTLPHGAYTCEVPGDAGGAWRIRKPDEDFVIIGASNYQVGGRRGSYLLTGDTVTMTSGAFNGKRYHRQSRGFLRLIGEDGKPSTLRCILSADVTP